jgi:hypothetical protein
VTVNESVPRLPAASTAVTVMTFVPFTSGTLVRLQLVVPVATPLPPRSLVYDTWLTPRSSAAVPPTLIDTAVAEYVDEAVGAVIVTVGGVVSGVVPATIVHVNDCVAVSVPSNARAVTG